MMSSGSSAGTVHQAHRTLRTALNEAVRRGHLPKNPAQVAKSPRPSESEIQPYSMDEVQLILKAAARERNGARWAVALALGLRQGEALGLKWSDVDLDARTVTVRRQLQRPRYAHGCAGDCGRSQAGRCPQRITTQPATQDTKSRAGRRVIGLPEPLVALLQQHRLDQDAERRLAGQLWQEDGWLFTTPTGGPIIPRSDWDHWKRLLKNAGVRDSRLHDARHTAATVLLLLGVPERMVMSVMGWSNTAMAARYQHVTDRMRHTVAQDVGPSLSTSRETPQQC